MRYYDVIYGELELDDVVEEILGRCWEVRRLKNIGMMNFRSVSMLGLTKCSRLEHAIGVSYLAQRFATRQSFDRVRRRTLIANALLHDISCAPFGHSVEWALMAMNQVEDHEVSSQWTLSPKMAAATIGRPAFLDSKPFDPLDFDLDKGMFEKIRQGTPGFTHIKSDGMDLDNIDSVFRMGHYLGLPNASCDHVFALVDALRLKEGNVEFSIANSAFPAAANWHRLRGSVYRKFIYDAEYLSFECQIFELIGSLALILGDQKEIAKLVDFPDDVLLWQYFTDDSFHSVRPLLRRLIALDSYQCLFIGRVTNREICEDLPSEARVKAFKEVFASTVIEEYQRKLDHGLAEGPVARWVYLLEKAASLPAGPFHIHITTDKRKTKRRVSLFIHDEVGTDQLVEIGEDGFFVVAALLCETKLTGKDRDFLINCFSTALSRWSGNSVQTEYRLAEKNAGQLMLGF